MSFGKTLKRIRLKHKDSLRGLAKKIDLHFTFIDKVEKCCSCLPWGKGNIKKGIFKGNFTWYIPKRRCYKNC